MVLLDDLAYSGLAIAWVTTRQGGARRQMRRNAPKARGRSRFGSLPELGTHHCNGDMNDALGPGLPGSTGRLNDASSPGSGETQGGSGRLMTSASSLV